MPSYGTSSPPDHRLTTGATALSGNTKDEGGVKKTTKAARRSFTDLAFSQSATANDARSRATDERHGLEDLYPKTPLDPQVALYIYTLKFFATVTFLGSCFSIWISVVASQDGYMERYMVRRDIHQCHKQDGNETNCLALKPYCKYMGVDAGCSPVPLHGLYDMSVQNIAPRSWRWWPVSILNLLFCVVFVVCTVYYVRTVNRYIKTVMRNQMEHAMGYRVACVRGIDADDARSTTAFYRNFLSEQAYFAARPSQATTTTVVATTHQSTHGPHTTVQHHRSHSADAPSSDSESDVSDGDDYYEQIECTGLGCLFSVIGCYYYSTRRRDACFTQPGKVRQILFTREPPHNMYPTIHDTEDAMADLQEALADEKAMRRRHAVRGFKPHKDTHRPTMLQELRRRNSAPVVMNGSTPSHSRRASDDEQRDAAANAATAARFTNPAASVPSASTTQVVVAGARSPSEDGGAFAASEEGNKHVKMLMMHAPFPQCCSRIPAVEYRTKKFREKATKLNSKIALVPRQRTTGAAFVIFSDSLSAYEFSNLFTARYGGPFVSACASIAGPSGHIIQTNLYADKFLLWIRFFLITVLFIVLLFTWSIPVGFLGSLDSISLIPGIGPAFRDYYYQRVPEWLRGVFTAYLPVIALALFNVALPHIVQRMVLAMGATTKSECDGGHLYLQYLFMILTAVIFQAALQGGLAQLGDLIADPDGEAIRNFFVACVTPQGGYWYAKVITAFSLTTWLDLIEPGHLLSAFLFRGRQHIQRNYDALFMPCEFHYPKLYSTDLMILSFGILFHMTIPLIGLFVSFFFFIRYVTQRAKLYDRYRPTLSPAHDCTDFGVSAQVIRSVQWQYCLAETGGVLLMSLRNHTGGVVLCSISMATAFILLVYVHLQTRHWIASLHNARTFFRPRRRHGVPEASTAEAATTTTATAPNGSAEQPAGSPAASAQGGGTAAAATAAQVAVLSSGRRVSTSTAAAYVRAVAAGAPPMPLEELEQICDDDEVGDYEDQRFSFYDRRQNPYIGHLLPRQPDAGVLYQPKHQRIAPVDVDAEVERMTQTVFTVERYWDRGMTWFEADEDEIEATRVSRPESGNNSGARYDVGGSSPVTMWPPHSPPSPSRPSAPMASEYHDTVAQPPAAAASPSPVPESDVDLMSESPRVVSNSTLLPSSATERVVPAANRASSQSLSGGGGAAAAVPPRPLQETVQPEANTALRESTDSAAPARVRSPPHADSTTTTAAAAAHVATPPSSSARSPSSEGPKEVAETAVPVTRDGDSKEME